MWKRVAHKCIWWIGTPTAGQLVGNRRKEWKHMHGHGGERDCLQNLLVHQQKCEPTMCGRWWLIGIDIANWRDRGSGRIIDVHLPGSRHGTFPYTFFMQNRLNAHFRWWNIWLAYAFFVMPFRYAKCLVTSYVPYHACMLMTFQPPTHTYPRPPMPPFVGQNILPNSLALGKLAFLWHLSFLLACFRRPFHTFPFIHFFFVFYTNRLVPFVANDKQNKKQAFLLIGTFFLSTSNPVLPSSIHS